MHLGSINISVKLKLELAKRLGVNLGLHGPDLDHHEKQAWPSLRRLVGVDEDGE